MKLNVWDLKRIQKNYNWRNCLKDQIENIYKIEEQMGKNFKSKN